jgi:ppGpp synthetase/RelA/SpoT-type nucleotidyltranferase
MIVPVEIETKMMEVRPYLSEVAERVRGTLSSLADLHGYAFASRIKEVRSLAEKIETGRFQSWSQLDDAYACALIFPSLQDEPALVDSLRNTYDIVEVRRRGASRKDPAVFRFDATRVIAKLRAGSSGVVADSPLVRVTFEVQLRTAFEHAWCVTTRSVSYKSDRIDWRRLRLAAQLRASVEQLDLLVAGYDALAEHLAPQQWPEIATKAQIEEAFKGGIEAGNIPSELAPQSWSRFCDNVYGLLRAVAIERREKETVALSRSIEILRLGIGEMDHASFPRSVSLLQFVLGTLARADYLPPSLGSYCAPVTAALLDLYPETRCLTNVFDFEMAK